MNCNNCKSDNAILIKCNGCMKVVCKICAPDGYCVDCRKPKKHERTIALNDYRRGLLKIMLRDYMRNYPASANYYHTARELLAELERGE